MDNQDARLLLGATAAVGSFEIMLYLKNLYTAFRMKEVPPDYEGMKGFNGLRKRTMIRCGIEVAGTVMNCGILAGKIWIGYYPVIWEVIRDKLGDRPFFVFWIFQFVEAVMNYVIFLPIASRVRKSLGTPAVEIRSLATGHSEKLLPLGVVGLVVMIFAKDVNRMVWFVLPLFVEFDELVLVSMKTLGTEKLIETDPDSPITKRVRDVAKIYKFSAKDILKDTNEIKVPEANYYEPNGVIIVSEKMMTLPEDTAFVLLSQEIGLYTRRYSSLKIGMSLIRLIGQGILLVMTFGSDRVSQIFTFDRTPYPYVPMYMGFAFIWPVFSNILFRIECLFHSWRVLDGDAVIHMSISTLGVSSLKAVAGQAEKYSIFDPWYSQLMRGYPTVDQRIKHLESLGH